MATLGTTFATAAFFMRGGEKPEQQQTPPINAKSKEEESFVKYGSPQSQSPYLARSTQNTR